MLHELLAARAWLDQWHGVRVPSSLAVDQKLFDHAYEQLNPSLTLARADQSRAADLVEYRRRALIA